MSGMFNGYLETILIYLAWSFHTTKRMALNCWLEKESAYSPHAEGTDRVDVCGHKEQHSAAGPSVAKRGILDSLVGERVVGEFDVTHV